MALKGFMSMVAHCPIPCNSLAPYATLCSTGSLSPEKEKHTTEISTADLFMGQWAKTQKLTENYDALKLEYAAKWGEPLSR